MQCIVDVCRAAGHTRGGELLNTVHRVVREIAIGGEYVLALSRGRSRT